MASLAAGDTVPGGDQIFTSRKLDRIHSKNERAWVQGLIWRILVLNSNVLQQYCSNGDVSVRRTKSEGCCMSKLLHAMRCAMTLLSLHTVPLITLPVHAHHSPPHRPHYSPSNVSSNAQRGPSIHALHDFSF